MRTTLAIDDDILAAAKELADVQQTSVGAVISSLARKALIPSQQSCSTRDGVLNSPSSPAASQSRSKSSISYAMKFSDEPSGRPDVHRVYGSDKDALRNGAQGLHLI